MAPQSKSQNDRHKAILAQLLQREGKKFENFVVVFRVFSKTVIDSPDLIFAGFSA